MSSILKILVDIPCEVYCDYEFKGNAVPQSLLKFELRKGIYLLDFKSKGEVLHSQKYIMKSNDEEDLLNITLSGIIEERRKYETVKQIEQMNVLIECHDKKFWLKNINENTEQEVRYNLISGYYEPYFDACGLLRVYKGVQNENGCLEKGSLVGCINKLGEIQIPFIYDYIIPFENPYTTIARKNGEIVFINKWGKVVFDNTFSYVDRFYKTLCIVGNEDKKGIINEQGEVVIPLCYDSIEYDFKISGFILSINNKKGFYGFDEFIIISAVYDNITGVGKGLMLVKRDNKSCVINRKGDEIFPAWYDNIVYDSCFIVTQHEKKGVLDIDASEVIPIQYDDIQSLPGGNLLVINNNKKGVYKKMENVS